MREDARLGLIAVAEFINLFIESINKLGKRG